MRRRRHAGGNASRESRVSSAGRPPRPAASEEHVMNLELFASLFATLATPTLAIVGPGRAPSPLAHTYSIVARDPKTGELGVAVQSHYFSVGPIVPWAEAGVGAVATQSLVLVDYGPPGLELMRQGYTARQARDAGRRCAAHHEGRPRGR